MNWRIVGAVARWEYARYAKLRDLIIGTVFFAVIFGLVGFAGEFVERKKYKPREIAVIGADLMGLDQVAQLQRFRLTTTTTDLPTLEQSVADKDLDAILIVRGGDEAELRVRSESGWQEEFLAVLSAHRLAQLTAPVQLERTVLGAEDASDGKAGTATVLIIVGTMLLGLFMGFSYVFVAITGEKAQKVTEAVLSAITPQQWIDGKILGLSLVALVNVLCYGVGYLLYKLAAVLFFDMPFQLPAGIDDPVTLLWIVLFAVGGFGFWLTLFAVVAATISDPNSSSRSSLLFLPFLPLSLTLAGMDQADAVWMRILALLPGISPAAMPVRILRGTPNLLEILLSLALLAAVVWLFRRAAGRVFGLSMLMTGKEPSWREVWRWAREA